jgi:polysaccharide export outer membrane protein
MRSKRNRNLSFLFSRAGAPGLAVMLAVAGVKPKPVLAQTPGAGTALTGAQRQAGQGRTNLLERTYVVQPGDTVIVSFRYTPEFNEEVVIGPDGRALFKAAGDVKVAGLTLTQLQHEIVQGSSSKLVEPEVAVSLKEVDRPHVFVAGEVNTPGRQEIRRPTTAMQAILMCGGPKDDAALGRVLLFRRIDADTAEVHVLQLARYDPKTRDRNDMLLQPDDMLLVRHDIPSRIERYVKLANLGFYINPLQSSAF